jgi:hypothetical protein
MTLPHLTWIELLLKTYTFHATFKTREQGQHTSNTSSKTSTHHIIDTYFFNNGGHPKGRLWMMKDHRTLEQDEIRKLLEKNNTNQKPRKLEIIAQRKLSRKGYNRTRNRK